MANFFPLIRTLERNVVKKLLFALGFMSFGWCQISVADYVSHAFIDANVEHAECLQAGAQAAKSIGVTKTQVANDSVVYGMNKEGYSLQFTCVSRMGASYYIINGPYSEKRGELANTFYKELSKVLQKIISSHS